MNGVQRCVRCGAVLPQANVAHPPRFHRCSCGQATHIQYSIGVKP